MSLSCVPLYFYGVPYLKSQLLFFWSNSAVLHGTYIQCSAVRDGTAGMGDNESLFSTDDPTDSPSDCLSGLLTPRLGSCTPPAISEDGVNLGLVLGKGYQGRPEVQEQIYALYCAYMRYRHAASTEQQTS